MDYVFEFIIKNVGIDREDDYPYTETDRQCDTAKVKPSFCICFPTIFFWNFLDFSDLSFQLKAHVVTIDSYENVPAKSEKALQKAVANQPVSVSIEAGGRSFQLYKSVGQRVKIGPLLGCLLGLFGQASWASSQASS